MFSGFKQFCHESLLPHDALQFWGKYWPQEPALLVLKSSLDFIQRMEGSNMSHTPVMRLTFPIVWTGLQNAFVAFYSIILRLLLNALQKLSKLLKFLDLKDPWQFHTLSTVKMCLYPILLLVRNLIIMLCTYNNSYYTLYP